MKRIFLVLGIVLATIAPAMASQSMNVLVRVQPTSPVRIDDCKAYINDTDVGNVNYYLDLAADYSNLDQNRSVMAVRIRFDVFNDFYEHLRTVYGNDDDPISAGGQSNRMQHYADFENFIRQQHPDSAYPVYFPDWEFINLNDTSKNLICSVDTVRFSDGTIWQAPNQPFTQTGVGKAFAAYMKSPAAMDFYSVKKPIQP